MTSVNHLATVCESRGSNAVCVRQVQLQSPFCPAAGRALHNSVVGHQYDVTGLLFCSLAITIFCLASSSAAAALLAPLSPSLTMSAITEVEVLVIGAGPTGFDARDADEFAAGFGTLRRHEIDESCARLNLRV